MIATEIIATGPTSYVARFRMEERVLPRKAYLPKGRYYCKSESCGFHTAGILHSIKSDERHCPVCDRRLS